MELLISGRPAASTGTDPQAPIWVSLQILVCLLP